MVGFLSPRAPDHPGRSRPTIVPERDVSRALADGRKVTGAAISHAGLPPAPGRLTSCHLARNALVRAWYWDRDRRGLAAVPARRITFGTENIRNGKAGFVGYLLLLAALFMSFPAQTQAHELTVFAAASVTEALKDVSAAWAAAGHKPLRLSFGASSTLARQIEQGAPANVFVSADDKWMDYLAAKKAIAPETRKALLGNTLVLVVPADKPRRVALDKGFDPMELLGPAGRLATGDPAHVPVGIYAEQALRKLGVWDHVAPRLARTADVRAALLLVERGEAPAAIVYATDAAASASVAIAGTFPSGSHDPIVYPVAATKSGDTAEARELLEFLSGDRARAIFTRRGFKAP